MVQNTVNTFHASHNATPLLHTTVLATIRQNFYCVSLNCFLLLICDAVHNAMTSQQCNTNAYCMVVLHACIHGPLVCSQPKPKIVRSATGSTEYGKPTLNLEVALSASSK